MGKSSGLTNGTQQTFTCSKSMKKTLEKKCDTCLKLTIKTSEQRQWRGSCVFIANFGPISHLLLVILSLTLSK